MTDLLSKQETEDDRDYRLKNERVAQHAKSEKRLISAILIASVFLIFTIFLLFKSADLKLDITARSVFPERMVNQEAKQLTIKLKEGQLKISELEAKVTELKEKVSLEEMRLQELRNRISLLEKRE